MNEALKLTVGQNLRYLGKGFPGYVQGQPYMVFVDYHTPTQYLVQYNELRLVVNMRYLLVVGKQKIKA